MSKSELTALEQALARQAEEPNPLEQVKAVRQQQLDRCAIKRSEEIEQLLQQAKDEQAKP